MGCSASVGLTLVHYDAPSAAETTPCATVCLRVPMVTHREILNTPHISRHRPRRHDGDVRGNVKAARDGAVTPRTPHAHHTHTTRTPHAHHTHTTRMSESARDDTGTMLGSAAMSMCLSSLASTLPHSGGGMPSCVLRFAGTNATFDSSVTLIDVVPLPFSLFHFPPRPFCIFLPSSIRCRRACSSSTI